MTAAPPFDCSQCGKRIGKSRTHVYVPATGTVWCAACSPRDHHPHTIGSRATIAALQPPTSTTEPTHEPHRPIPLADPFPQQVTRRPPTTTGCRPHHRGGDAMSTYLHHGLADRLPDAPAPASWFANLARTAELIGRRAWRWNGTEYVQITTTTTEENTHVR